MNNSTSIGDGRISRKIKKIIVWIIVISGVGISLDVLYYAFMVTRSQQIESQVYSSPAEIPELKMVERDIPIKGRCQVVRIKSYEYEQLWIYGQYDEIKKKHYLPNLNFLLTDSYTKEFEQKIDQLNEKLRGYKLPGPDKSSQCAFGIYSTNTNGQSAPRYRVILTVEINMTSVITAAINDHAHVWLEIIMKQHRQ